MREEAILLKFPFHHLLSKIVLRIFLCELFSTNIFDQNFKPLFSSNSVFNFQLPQNPIKLHRNLIYKPAAAAVVAEDNAMDGRSGTKSKKQFFPHSSAFNMI